MDINAAVFEAEIIVFVFVGIVYVIVEVANVIGICFFDNVGEVQIIDVNSILNFKVVSIVFHGISIEVLDKLSVMKVNYVNEVYVILNSVKNILVGVKVCKDVDILVEKIVNLYNFTENSIVDSKKIVVNGESIIRVFVNYVSCLGAENVHLNFDFFYLNFINFKKSNF